MSTAVVLDLPDALAAQINQEKEHVPGILERGFRELQMERTGSAQAIDEIIAVLASQPTPEEILALHPSPQLQARVSELLAGSKNGKLSHSEEIELERYLTIEHLVRMAKSHAYQQLATQAAS
jgi:hypothetical protein